MFLQAASIPLRAPFESLEEAQTSSPMSNPRIPGRQKPVLPVVLIWKESCAGRPSVVNIWVVPLLTFFMPPRSAQTATLSFICIASPSR